MDLLRHYWKIRELWIHRQAVKLRPWLGYGLLLVAMTRARLLTRKRQPGPRRLLLLVSQFPPANNGGVFRPLHLAVHFARSGWDVTVVTGPVPAQPLELGVHLRKKLPGSVRVVNLPDCNTPSFRSWGFPSVEGGFFNAIATARWSLRHSREWQPDLVVASGPKFYNFVAASWLKRAYACGLILDYRDEWTESMPSFVHLGRDDRSYEAAALEMADRIVVVTASMQRHMREAFPTNDPAKCHCIPNGWDPEDFVHLAREAPDPDEKIVVAYFGSLGDDYAVTPLLKLLQHGWDTFQPVIERLRIECYGVCHGTVREEIAASRAAALFSFHDALPKQEMFARMLAADALLVLNPRAFARSMQGKTYEYAASGRPLIVLGAGGEVSALVNGLACGWVVSEDDHAGLFAAIEASRVYANPRPERVTEWLAANTRSNQSLRFVALAEETLVMK